jgi:hypothetical protein
MFHEKLLHLLIGGILTLHVNGQLIILKAIEVIISQS